MGETITRGLGFREILSRGCESVLHGDIYAQGFKRSGDLLEHAIFQDSRVWGPFFGCLIHENPMCLA